MRKVLLMLAPMVAMLPTLALAGEDSSGGTPTVMDEVVVTATKTTETRGGVVNTVVLKDSLDIEETPASSLGEALAGEPGLDWRTYGNYGGATETLSIRGMNADGTQVAVDGVVINSPSLGTADLSLVSLNSIERVEVIEGPGSVLYGSGASGGTVNIITKSPSRDGNTGKIEAGIGSQATTYVAGENGGFLIGDLGYYLTFNHKESDGFRDNSDLTHNDASLKLVLDKGKPFLATLDVGLVDRDYGLPGVKPPAGTLPYILNGTAFYNGDSATLLDHGSEKDGRAALTFKGAATNWLDWRFKGDFLKQDSNSISRYYWDGTGEKTEITNTVAGVEGNVNLHPVKWANLLLGNDYRNYDYNSKSGGLDTAGAETGYLLTDESHRVFTNGTFAELSVQPIDKVKVIGGYRHEYHSLFGNEDVIRYGTVITPWKDAAIKLNRGQHYKAPTMNDLFWPDDGYSTKGNPDLKPETGWHSDITLEQGGLFNGKLFVSATWFKWNVDDKIRWNYDPTTYYYTPLNLDTYDATGWEFHVKVGPYYAVQADFSLTLLDASEQMGSGPTRAALYTPDQQVKIQLSHVSDFGLTSSVTTRFTGSRPGYYASKTATEPTIELDSYWTVDVKLQQAIGEHWKVTLQALNLLDEKYDTYIGTFYPTYTQCPYPGAGRSVLASVAYVW